MRSDGRGEGGRRELTERGKVGREGWKGDGKEGEWAIQFPNVIF